MRRFELVQGIAALLLQDDIDTDQVLPSSYLRGLHSDYGVGLFAQWRKDPDFVLAQPAYQSAKILIAGANFGCGSTREHAVWAIDGFGFRVLIARSFPEVFRANCLKNALLPIVLDEAPHAALVEAVRGAGSTGQFTVDLVNLRITGPGEFTLAFQIAPSDRTALLEGLDEIGMSLRASDAIDAYEARERAERPWLQELKKPS
jgi:3-isopropylmalate/(R)-2-methylmalate dehydratase small subunit